MDQCGSDWLVEGTTVAPEFLVGALANGVPRCFSVTAVSVDGFESDRSPLRGDTPRPDSRNVALVRRADHARTAPASASGMTLTTTARPSPASWAWCGSADAPDIDFFVDRDGNGDLFLTPVRAGTGVEFYDENDPVEDLTSIDFAEDLTYRTTGIQALPGFGYVFETDGGDGFVRYGAVRVQHVGTTFLILDWAFQTDPGNPELLVWGVSTSVACRAAFRGVANFGRCPPHQITLDGRSLTIDDVVRIAREPGTAPGSTRARQALIASRRLVEQAIASGQTIYGINTGFGKLANVRIAPDKLDSSRST